MTGNYSRLATKQKSSHYIILGLNTNTLLQNLYHPSEEGDDFDFAFEKEFFFYRKTQIYSFYNCKHYGIMELWGDGNTHLIS